MKILKLSPKDDIQHILDSLREPATIYLEKGLYKQKLEIKGDDITLIGENRETTVISYDDYARKIHEDGKEYNTFRTFSLCVSGERARLENLTVENSNTDPREKGQCVALSVNARAFSAKNVILKSTQDTLFLYPFPDDLVIRYRGFIPHRQLYTEGTSLHLFENCDIYGTVDFIFGGAEAYFKNCRIISLSDGREKGYIAAPCHSLAEEYGFCFIDCDMINAGAAAGSVALARPWRDFGKSTFINCRLANHIDPLLFDKWNDTDRDKTARFSYYGLTCDFSPAPVKWSSELTKQQAETIIKRCESSFNKH